MALPRQLSWLPTATTLCAYWAAFTVAMVALTAWMGVELPSVARGVPFFLAGLATGRLADVASSHRVIAPIVVAVVSAAAWTSFTWVTSDVSVGGALVLFAVSLPVNGLAGLWAYFGLSLGGRLRRGPPAAAGQVGEFDDLERELKEEMARDSDANSSTRL
jgi:hypothetical protein